MIELLSNELKKLKANVHVYRLEKDFTYKTGIDVGQAYTFKNMDGKVEMQIFKGGEILIKKGVMWDGCSPKIKIRDSFYIGTPDGPIDYNTGKPKCYYGTLVHDKLYKHCKHIPFTRLQCDTFMRDLFRESNFSLADLYFRVVRLLGGLFWKS